MIFLSATPTPTHTPTPTPIYIDNLPQEFAGHMYTFIYDLFLMLRQIEIPFTHVNCFQVFVGSIALAATFYGLSLIYGRGKGRDHE